MDKEEKEFLLDEITIFKDKRKLHKDIFNAVENAKFHFREQIPFFSDPIFGSSKKKLVTYHLFEIDCKKQCIFVKKCPYWKKRPIRNGNHVPCWNFTGNSLNLQICERCGSIRIIEYPKRIKGICQACRGQSEGEEHPDPKFYDNPVSHYLYECMKQRRMEELASE